MKPRALRATFWKRIGSKIAKQWAHRILFESLWALLGWFWMPFWRPLSFEGGPQFCLDIEANKMRKNGILGRVLKKTWISMDVRRHNSRAWSCNKRVWQVTCCNFIGLGGYEFWWKMDAQMVQQIIKFEPLGAHGRDLWRFCEVLKRFVFWWVFGSAKSLPNITMISDFGGQVEKR